VQKRLRGLDARRVLKILKHFGFHLERQKGSHQQWVKIDSGRLNRVTVDPNLRDFDPGTLKSIIEQSGFSATEWIQALNKI